MLVEYLNNYKVGITNREKTVKLIVKLSMMRECKNCKHCNKIMKNHGWIDTLEGGHIVCPGDFIIKGVEGELYPCKPVIFEKTYELVE